jgi:glycosyltransferase involved in cell wall biosynthesis/2-polyprenyl-3-methyl-5-hydroxy-6-metoxy-1,4-benzoquinol methylase
MPVYNDDKFVQRAVESILDQDVKDIEVILVDDGSTDKSKEVIKRLEDSDKRVKAIYFKKNKGACVARNAGAKIAKGENYVHLPADSLLYPGMARIWLNVLEDNPEHDFVYGGYRVTTEDFKPIDGGDFFFQPFDPYLLEVQNYIDGSFPIRAKVYWEIAKLMNQPDGLWDSKIKSLQDWDFWLSVVKEGKKTGHYIPDIFFETTAPHKGGLSEDSNNNWIERTNQIKDKHGIPRRNLCVASIGARFHGIHTAKILGADFKEMPSFKPHEYDAIYVIGFYPQFAAQQNQMFLNSLHNPEFGYTPTKKVVHLVGSDVDQLWKCSMQSIKVWRSYFKNTIDELLVESQFIQDELKELGIEGSKIIPLPPNKLFNVMPLPKKFTVGVYMPTVNADFYRPNEMLRIAKACPNIRFKFFGNPYIKGKRLLKRTKDKEGKKVEVYDYNEGEKTNIEDVGYVEMGEFVKECSAIMRFPVHDGLPLSVLEFLTAGRYAVNSVPIKHAVHVREFSIERVVKELNKLKKIKEPNVEGSRYWREELNHEKYIKTIKDLTEYKPEEYWENRAESWNVQAGIEPSYTEEIKKFIDEVKPKSVIDMGCGNGKWYPLLSTLGEYTGFDISQKLVNIAHKNHPKGIFWAAKVEDFVPIGVKPAQKADLAFSFTTLEHIIPKDFPKAVENIKKIAKYLLLIEPENFTSRYYCHSHDYRKHFNVIKEEKLDDKTIMLCKLH